MKKTIALLLVLFLLVQMVPAVTFAAADAPLNMVATISENVATIKVVATSDFDVANFSLQLATPEGCSILTIAKGADFDAVVSGSFTSNKGTGMASCTAGDAEVGAAVKAGNELVVFTVDMTDAVDSKITFNATVTAAANVDGDSLEWSGAAMASNEVETQPAPPAVKTGYEVYYVPNSNADTENEKDGFVEYSYDKDAGKWNNTVTADVYIVSYDKDVVLQAYDIFISHDNKLIYDSNTLEKGVAHTESEGNVLTHIQAVGDDGDPDNAVSIELTKGVPVKLGTVNFTIDTDNAIHDEELDLSLVMGTNTKDVTNIAVAEDEGSYYPVDGTAVKGVEIKQLWTITWDPDNGDAVTEVEVGHNEMPTEIEDPEKADDQYTYTFTGWDPEVVKATADATYTAKYTTTTNTYTVTWVNADGTVLETDEDVPYGTMPTYNGATPTKVATEQYEYTFAGWTPEVSEVTGDIEYTATYTETLRKYTVTFHANYDGANSEPITQNFTYNQTFALNANTFVHSDPSMKFKNWNTEPDGSGVTYSDKKEVTLTADLVLYAQWSEGHEVETGDHVSADMSVAHEGDQVTVTVTVPEGYELDEVTITDGNGDNVNYTINEDGEYVFTMPNADVQVTATFTALPYTVTVIQPTEGGELSVVDPKEQYHIGDTVKLTSTPAAGYALVKYIVKNGDQIVYEGTAAAFTMPAANVTVTAEFEKIPLDLNMDEGIVAKDEEGNEIEQAKVGEEVTLIPDPDPGYELGEGGFTVKDESGEEIPVDDEGKFTMPDSSVTISADFDPVEYTITLDVNGGTPLTNATISYNIETAEFTLPTPTKALYTFKGWKVTVEDGNWAKDTVFGPESDTMKVAQQYGNVTLTAQWEPNTAAVEVEQYKYAYTGYWMIRVSAEGLADNQQYLFGGEAMYFIDDANYKVGNSTKVFYTLIPVSANGKTYIKDGKLTADGYAALSIGTCTERAEIDYNNRDINNDGVVNIADANVVYQMVVHGGAYYSDSQLNVEQRLRADLAKDSADHRGSIADVTVIVNEINAG